MSLREALPGDFFDTIWQQVPAKLPGLAAAVLPELMTHPGALRDVVMAHCGSRGDGQTIWFLERVTDVLPEFTQLQAELIRVFERDDVWLDLFVARGAASIGRHLDHSNNNITLQLAGTQHWQLRPPSSIPPAARRLRALGEPVIGSLSDGTGDEEKVHLLDPGDALYIPSMWSYEGVSESDNISISLVVNIATGPGSVARRPMQLNAATGPDAMSDSGVTRQVAPAATLPAKTSPRREPPTLRLDMNWLRQYLGGTPQVPTEGLVLFDPGASAAIASVAARRTMKRFATGLVTSSARTSERRARLVYAAIAAVLHRLSPEQLDRAMTDPDITSWTAHAARRRDDSQMRVPPRNDPSVDALATALLPELAQYHDGPPLLIHPPTDIDEAVTLRRLGLRIPEAGPLALLVADGNIIAIERASLTEIGEPLAVIGTQDSAVLPAGPILCRAASRWFEQHAPQGAAVHASDNESFGELASCLHSAIMLLDQHYPAAAAVFRSNIRVLLPLSPNGHRANNYSLPTFRGLIATSAREPYMLAQAIAHETAHNQVNSLLEIIQLCHNPTEEVISPVVGLPRPLTALFHGSIAFVQDILVSRALLAAGHPASERIQRYLDGRVETVRDTTTLLQGNADLSPTGSAVVSQIEQVLAGTCPQLVRVQE